MATVIEQIKGFKVPTPIMHQFVDGQGNTDTNAYHSALYVFERVLSTYCEGLNNCPDAGVIFSIVTDKGLARYMVVDYKTLIHLNNNKNIKASGYYIKNLRPSDIRVLVLAEYDAQYNEIFERASA